MADTTNTRDIAVTVRDADGRVMEAPDAATQRNTAFFSDTVDTLKAAHREGWDAERTNSALTGVQRQHGYWSDTPVLGSALRRVGLGLAALALAACSGAGAADRAWEEAELPMPILVAYVEAGGEPEMISTMKAAYEDIGRCCFRSDDNFSLRSDAPSGRALTAQDVFDAVDPRASLYAIGLPDLEYTSLVEPLFGGRIRRHVMAEPQEGCVVVSGVRDGIRRAGVLNAYEDDPREGQTALSRCNISALLLLHGLPEEEAMDYKAYAVKDRRYDWMNAPDLDQIKLRDLELNGPLVWPGAEATDGGG